ncbi:MAG: TatD family hydrolase [Chlorobi bacterium]|nr:TatD family hydrolase [Chlorobiota bacterium]
MFFVDSHTHLYLEQFDNDRIQVVERAIAEGVEMMLLPNIDKGSVDNMMALCSEFPDNCFPMMGLHPTSVGDNYEEELATVEDQLEKHPYIAVGEIGIDLYWDKTFKAQQEDAFRRQLKLAKKLSMPVSIHTRDSFDEVYNIVKDEHTGSLKGVFHCFTGTNEQAEKIMEMGFFMGIGGVLTFKNSGLDQVVKDIPPDFLLLETDSPFLTPAPYRGKRNESAYVRLIASKLAEIKNIAIEEIAGKTSANAMKLFNINRKQQH